MWNTIELRELRTFLVLAPERRFGQTAERVFASTSRVSQLLRSLERRRRRSTGVKRAFTPA